MKEISTRHKLSEIDRGALKAFCASCEMVVEIRPQTTRGSRYYICAVAKAMRARKHKFRARYGIDQELYDSLLEVEGGRCAICRALPSPERPLQVDHCHETNKIRGLLCFNCNAGIGQMKDSIALLQAAIDYLEIRRR